MTKLSVNINKIATLRNSRGGNVPDVIQAAVDIQKFGGQGITIHPRPDERHIKYKDAYDLIPVITTEYNIEGNPIPEFIDLVLKVKPTQVTLVPDAPDAVTSDAGWDTITHKAFLEEVISELKRNHIRTSVFTDTRLDYIEGAAAVGTDRIELYTEAFAKGYSLGDESAITPYVKAAEFANSLGLGVNAGHDLSLQNIRFFKSSIPSLLEVSIGHALISESIYLGLQNVISMYLNKLQQN